MRELGFFMPLIVLVIWLGIYPVPVLDVMHTSVANLIVQATASKLPAADLLAQAEMLQHAVTH